MKIVWFTPFAARSPVAASSARVARALAAAGHDPLIVRLDAADTPQHSWSHPVGHWSDWSTLGPHDATFYNIGDAFDDFAPVYDLLRRRPGTVIVHGDTLDGYFRRYFQAVGPSAAAGQARTPLERIAREATATIAADRGVADALRAISAGLVLNAAPPADDDAADVYVEKLMRFAAMATAVDPLVRLSRMIGDRLGEMGLPRSDPLVGRVAAAAEDMFRLSRVALSQADPL